MSLWSSVEGLFRTGRHARRRAAAAAEQEATLSLQQRKETEEKRKKEKKRAQQIKMRRLRSQRGSSFFAEYGRETIG